MKAQKIFLGFCAVLWVLSEDCNCETAKETHNKWRELFQVLKANWASGNLAPCRATPEETQSWIYLLRLFTPEREISGVMNYAWPRLPFYTEHLKALTEAPSPGDIRVCGMLPVNRPSVCTANLCRYCSQKDHYEEISKYPILKSICNGTNDQPPANAELTEEMKKELAGILKPKVEAPGALTADEATWWWRKSESAGAGKGENCNASPEFTWSMRYLRKMFEATGKTEEELEAHAQFYAEKLKWLKGAEEETVACAKGKETWFGKTCGWDGVCLECSKIEDTEPFSPGCELWESIDDWENRNLPPRPQPTTYESPQEALRIWVDAFMSVKNSSVDKNSEDKSCSASVEQTLSWAWLKELFGFNSSAGVLQWAWPRIGFFEQKLAEVVKAPNNTYCEWKLGDPQDTFLCVGGKCRGCWELKESNEKDFLELYVRRCEGQHEHAPESENLPRKKEVEGMQLNVEMEEPTGKLTFAEALGWKETLGKTAVKKRHEECDVPPKLTLSGKLLMGRLTKVRVGGEKRGWRWRTADEVKAGMEINWDKLWWLKDVNKTREFCGNKLVCGMDKRCIPCKIAMTMQMDKAEELQPLKEACEEEVEFAEEAEEGMQSTTEAATEMTTETSGAGVMIGGTWRTVMVFIAATFWVSFHP